MAKIISFDNDPSNEDENQNEYFPCHFINNINDPDVKYCKFFLYGFCFMDEYDTCPYKSI